MDDRFYTRTVTCSVRAEQEWFDKVKEIAEKLGMNWNQFIVYVVNEYIKDKDNNEYWLLTFNTRVQ